MKATNCCINIADVVQSISSSWKRLEIIVTSDIRVVPIRLDLDWHHSPTQPSPAPSLHLVIVGVHVWRTYRHVITYKYYIITTWVLSILHHLDGDSVVRNELRIHLIFSRTLASNNNNQPYALCSYWIINYSVSLN